MKVNLIIRRQSDRSEVERVVVEHASEGKVEKVMRGILRQMDTEQYFIEEVEEK